MCTNKLYDVIVIGGGHAGTEAALAAARLGAKTLLITQNIDTLGQMSCNPAIGGIGKGHLVKEIDALDGIMARATDAAGIHFRTLNASKGPAVRATRAQTDRMLYRQAIRLTLEKTDNLTLFQDSVEDIVIENDIVQAVVTRLGLTFNAKAVVLTTGTFLNGKIHIGSEQHAGGRAGDPPTIHLAQKLKALGLPVGRLKTGTPPRINGRTLDYSQMERQPGDSPRPVFSFLSDSSVHPEQVACYITQTTKKTHEIIQNNLHLSAMYGGMIEGIGPRYCPSIEDKVVRFKDKLSHQIFVEPEGLNTTEIYPNGISTSLPFEVQKAFVQSIKGFEQAEITRAGYAIEYDYFNPCGLTAYLQTKPIRNLFFAGQINGTTGYEEAAAQGLIAGLNAAKFAQDKPLWSPRRNEAYIGVLIDDLITQGTQEPYRMFTSRAEYRLLLREDNADSRLTEIGRELGLVEETRWRAFCEKKEAIEQAKALLKDTWVRLKDAEVLNPFLSSPLLQDTPALALLKRPEVRYEQLQAIEALNLPPLKPVISQQIEVQIKYQGYIDRQQLDIEKLAHYENMKLPKGFVFEKVSGLSAEVVQKLNAIRPATLAQAGRISGVTPAALSLLLIYLKKQKQPA